MAGEPPLDGRRRDDHNLLMLSELVRRPLWGTAVALPFAIPAVREHEGRGCVGTDKRSEKMQRKKLYLLAILVLVMIVAFRVF